MKMVFCPYFLIQMSKWPHLKIVSYFTFMLLGSSILTMLLYIWGQAKRPKMVQNGYFGLFWAYWPSPKCQNKCYMTHIDETSSPLKDEVIWTFKSKVMGKAPFSSIFPPKNAILSSKKRNLKNGGIWWCKIPVFLHAALLHLDIGYPSSPRPKVKVG